MIVRILLISLLAVLVGCAPRGETKSLDEVYQVSKSRYISASSTATASPNVESAKKVAELVEQLVVNDQKKATDFNQVAELLSSLVLHAGFTVRPGMTEIANQYKSLADAKNFSDEGVKLLGTRTLNVLTRELSTTQFEL